MDLQLHWTSELVTSLVKNKMYSEPRTHHSALGHKLPGRPQAGPESHHSVNPRLWVSLWGDNSSKTQLLLLETLAQSPCNCMCQLLEWALSLLACCFPSLDLGKVLPGPSHDPGQRLSKAFLS